MSVLGHFTSWQNGEAVTSSELDSLHVKWEHSDAAQSSEGQESAPEAWHIHSRLSCSFVTAKGTVLSPAPPASAWQLCLPVLYIILPAELAGQAQP